MELRVRRGVLSDLEERFEDIVNHLLEVLDDSGLLVDVVQAGDLRRQTACGWEGQGWKNVIQVGDEKGWVRLGSSY